MNISLLLPVHYHLYVYVHVKVKKGQVTEIETKLSETYALKTTPTDRVDN